MRSLGTALVVLAAFFAALAGFVITAAGGRTVVDRRTYRACTRRG